MQSLRRKLGGNAQGLTYEVEVVAQYASECRGDVTPRRGVRRAVALGAGGRHARRRRKRRPCSFSLPATHPALLNAPSLAAELPLPSGARAQFLLKRRSRLCVTEPEAVDAAGGVEWNTRCVQVRPRDPPRGCCCAVCMECGWLQVCWQSEGCCFFDAATHQLARLFRQTATLFKDGDAWRPKEFVFKVQRLLGGCSACASQLSACCVRSCLCSCAPAACCEKPWLPPCAFCVPIQPLPLHVAWMLLLTRAHPCPVADNPRLGQEAAQTVARASLDLSQFCTAEPFGPKQLVVPLQ